MPKPAEFCVARWELAAWKAQRNEDGRLLKGLGLSLSPVLTPAVPIVPRCQTPRGFPILCTFCREVL